MKPKQKNNENQKKKIINTTIRKPVTSPKTLLSGKWMIAEMSEWDKEFCDQEIKAYIAIKGNGGEFQFGLVCGNMDGEFINSPFGAVFDFTFLGNDECDETSGDGWLRTIDGKIANGEIRFHEGDKSSFTARKIMAKEKHSKKEAKK